MLFLCFLKREREGWCGMWNVEWRNWTLYIFFWLNKNWTLYITSHVPVSNISFFFSFLFSLNVPLISTICPLKEIILCFPDLCFQFHFHDWYLYFHCFGDWYIYPRFLDAWYQNPKITYTKSYPFFCFCFFRKILFLLILFLIFSPQILNYSNYLPSINFVLSGHFC